MIFTDALPAMAAVPPTPSATSSALPRRRDVVGTHDVHHVHAPSQFASEDQRLAIGLGTVARGQPPSPFIGAGTIVAMQWVVFGAAILRHLMF